MPRLLQPAATMVALWRAIPRGTALVEFGLAAPFLILLIVALIDFGLGYYSYLQAQGAASAGAEYASYHTFDQTNIENAVTGGTNLPTSTSCPPPSGRISACPVPAEVCGCTSGGTFTPGGTFNSATGTCTGTCTGGTTPGIYALVNAEVNYTPILPYPWLGGCCTLTGTAYRRLQ